MATNFPNSLDSLSNPTSTDKQDIVLHSSQHANANDAIEALQAKVGIDGSTDPSSLDYKLSQASPLTTKGDIFVRSASGNTRLPVGTDGQMMVADSTEPLGVKYINPTSGGTVTTASIVSANGFTGTVANPTTTPAITLGTSVTGLLKGNGTGVSSATAGTDYFAPLGTDIPVADGGTGVSTLTPYAPIFGGTTSTNPVQSGTVGLTGQVLTSNGTGALPTFQNVGGNKIYLSSTQVVNTGSGEKTLYSFTIPANTLGTANCIEGRIVLSVLNTSGSGRNHNINIKIGSTTICQVSLYSAAISLNSKGEMIFSIFGNGNTSAQKTIANLNLAQSGYSYANEGIIIGIGTSTFDSTIDQTITITNSPDVSGPCTAESIIVTKIV